MATSPTLPNAVRGRLAEAIAAEPGGATWISDDEALLNAVARGEQSDVAWQRSWTVREADARLLPTLATLARTDHLGAVRHIA